MIFQHEVVSNKKLNSKFILIKFKSKSSAFSFKVGQYTIVKINNGVFRCYSIASLPGELPYWEIFVDITPGGPGTTYLNALKPGKIIETLPASGHLELNQKLKKYIFGATGCGIAPFLPMVKSLSKDEQNTVYLYWGLRNEDDIALTDLMGAYSKANSNFHFEIVLSKPSKKWKGKVGHITDEVLKTASNFLFNKACVFLSGSDEFINETDELLLKQKFPGKFIFKEGCY